MADDRSRGSPPSALGAREGWTIAIVATLVMAVSYVDRQTFAALSPTVCAEMRIGPAVYGRLTAAFSVAYLVGAPLAGWMVDRVGARSGLVTAVLAWSAVAAMHAFVPTVLALFALRIALGTAEAPSFPGAAQAVRRSLPPAHRSAGFGLLFTGSSLGAMIAAPLAIALHARYGWRFAFFGTAAVGLSWVPAWLAVTRSPRARAALVTRNEETLRVSPLSLLPLLRAPAVARACVLIVASAPAINFVFNWLPKYLVAERGLTQNGLAAYLWAPPLCFDVGAIGFGVVASVRRRGAVGVPRDLVVLAGALATCLALIPWAGGARGAVALASASMAGGGGLFALLTSDALARVSLARVSSAGGLCAAAQSLAYVAANLLVGFVLERTPSYGRVLVTLGAINVPGVLAWLLWPVASGAQKAHLERT